MKNSIWAVILCCLSFSAFAQDPPKGFKPDFDLMRRAVILGAMADVYSIYCKQDADMAERFIKSFKEKGLTQEQEEHLILAQTEAFSSTAEKIKEEGKGCEDIEFSLKRVEVMRKLKDISYLLNGIDPKTVPEKPIELPDELLEEEPQAL